METDLEFQWQRRMKTSVLSMVRAFRNPVMARVSVSVQCIILRFGLAVASGDVVMTQQFVQSKVNSNSKYSSIIKLNLFTIVLTNFPQIILLSNTC